LLSASPLVGCGPDKAERGLVVTDETAVPDSPAEDALTEQQREQQVTKEEEAAADKDFDAAAGGDAPPSQPAP
jgi:hypothetical protein